MKSEKAGDYYSFNSSGDKHLISPHNTTLESNIKFMRMNYPLVEFNPLNLVFYTQQKLSIAEGV